MTGALGRRLPHNSKQAKPASRRQHFTEPGRLATAKSANIRRRML
jgi:hypothetical protein